MRTCGQCELKIKIPIFRRVEFKSETYILKETVLQTIGLDLFGPDWASPNVNFNLKSPFLQLKNLTNYSLQHTV
jgi:hypothetical protein